MFHVLKLKATKYMPSADTKKHTCITDTDPLHIFHKILVVIRDWDMSICVAQTSLLKHSSDASAINKLRTLKIFLPKFEILKLKSDQHGISNNKAFPPLNS